jgi:general stress protein 26
MKLMNVEKFVRSRKVALLGSVDENGAPNIKAMLAPRQMIGLKEFYFSTNLSALRTQQYLKNPKACIYFFRKGLISYTGVMLRGTMEVVTEQEVKNLLWRKGDTRFYKYGVTDPDYCVLKFTAESGRYYKDFKTEEFEVK